VAVVPVLLLGNAEVLLAAGVGFAAVVAVVEPLGAFAVRAVGFAADGVRVDGVVDVVLAVGALADVVLGDGRDGASSVGVGRVGVVPVAVVVDVLTGVVDEVGVFESFAAGAVTVVVALTVGDGTLIALGGFRLDVR
jgi:hypothetical protein